MRTTTPDAAGSGSRRKRGRKESGDGLHPARDLEAPLDRTERMFLRLIGETGLTPAAVCARYAHPSASDP